MQKRCFRPSFTATRHGTKENYPHNGRHSLELETCDANLCVIRFSASAVAKYILYARNAGATFEHPFSEPPCGTLRTPTRTLRISVIDIKNNDFHLGTGLLRQPVTVSI